MHSQELALPVHWIRNNNIWKREETKRVLKQRGLQFDAEVFLCQTGMQAPNGLPIGKVLIFCTFWLVVKPPVLLHCLRLQLDSNSESSLQTGDYGKFLLQSSP